MRFWDASAVVPLCLQERQSRGLRALAEEDPGIIAWWGTPVECCSAFARLRRDGLLTDEEEQAARGALAALCSSWTEIQPSRMVREGAQRALLLHPLRASDSLQLASALVWAKGHAAGSAFVCLDRRLGQAARREGFQVLSAQ